MLVTDGVPYNYKEIFEEYNWRSVEGSDAIEIPVRVFTYLIGKEVPDVREIRWMACSNQGYYKHLSTIAEVRENVLQYISVMARPLVLGKTYHPVIWTQVYADIADPKMTDWLWEMKEREIQKEKTLRSIKSLEKSLSQNDPVVYTDDEVMPKLTIEEDNTHDSYPYKMMTSIAIPVFDERQYGSRIANLLGVAGTDVPNSDIKQLMVPHLLGVNAYAFLVTNNGYVMLHPDIRPVFQGILKPSYNSIDITEVELYDEDTEQSRTFNHPLLLFRERLVNLTNGSNSLNVRYHYDNMKRASQMKRRYYHNAIGGQPFELVVALPDSYGLNRVEAELEIKRAHSKGFVTGKKVTEYFRGRNWKVHPEWFYCKYRYGNEHNFETPEEEFYHFLNRSTQVGWKWPLKRSEASPDHMCDRRLFQSLVYDAEVTEWFSDNFSSLSAEEKGQDMRQRFGLTLVFMATRSGLTRWQDISLANEFEEKLTPHFSEKNNKAIDEIWYKRAVEYYGTDPNAFVYSVPFKAGEDNDTLVTASHAIFHTEGSRSAPAAVVGFQFQHTALHARFMNITSTCDKQPCDHTCSRDTLNCYILDNNGYVVVSEDREHTGMFFGEIHGGIMKLLVSDGIYKPIVIYDYQAVCFEQVPDNNNSCRMFTPISYITWMINWFFGRLIWIIGQTHFNWLLGYGNPIESFEDEAYGESAPPDNQVPEESSSQGDKFRNRVMINKTLPQPCDTRITLYQLSQDFKKNHNVHQTHCARPYTLTPVHYSNMVLVVVYAECSVPNNDPITTDPMKIEYDNASVACYKLSPERLEEFGPLPRRRLKPCICLHEEESQIDDCGSGTRLEFSIILYLFLAIKYAAHFVTLLTNS